MPTNKTLPSIDYKRILYVTDLSESGRHAFPHAASIARRFNSELTVFHVVDPGKLESLLGYANEELWELLTKQTLEEAREILYSRKRDNVEIINNVEQFCEESLDSTTEEPVVAYDIKVEMGEALEKILNEAHSGNYDLLIISKHGHRLSVKDAVIGDTARRILRRCKIPVMVVPLPK
jgi:nucleotide-binding universal stress UspA family protein